MIDFSFAQFRTMLSVIRRGEVREEIDAEGLLGDFSEKTPTTGKRVLSGVLLVVLALVLFGAGSLMSSTDLDIVQVFFMMIAMLVVLVVIVGFFQAVNTLYFVKDTGFYLALPISAVTIIAAKLTYFICSQVLVNCIVVAFGLGFLYGRGADASSYVALVLAFLPCVIATALALIIIVIPVMRFSRVAADKDRFSRIFGVLTTVVALVVAFAVNFGTNNISSSTMSSMGDVVSHGAVSVVLAIVCAPTLLVSEVFSGNAVLGLLGMYVLAALYVAVTALFAKKWYFAGVQGMQSGSGKKSRKRYSEGDLGGAVKQRSQFKAFLSQDVATLLRVPAFFQQFVASMILEPVAVVAVAVMGICLRETETTNEVRDLVLASSIDANTHLALLMAALVAGVFSCLTSHMYAFALGRDGEDFFFMRAMPMSMRDYVMAKFASGYLITRVPFFVAILVVLIVLGVAVDVAVLSMLAFALPLTAVDLTMFALGSRKPQLKWENEAQLLKQSSLYLYLFLAFVIGIVAFTVPGAVAFAFSVLGISGYVGALAMLVVCVGECVGAAAYMLLAAPDNMELARL